MGFEALVDRAGGGGHCTNNTRPGTRLPVIYTINCSYVYMVLFYEHYCSRKKNRSALFFHFYVLFFGPSEWIRN